MSLQVTRSALKVSQREIFCGQASFIRPGLGGTVITAVAGLRIDICMRHYAFD